MIAAADAPPGRRRVPWRRCSGGGDAGERRALTALVMTCECGEVARAETEDELIAAVERHVAEQHPDLVGTFSREDILAMAEMV